MDTICEGSIKLGTACRKCEKCETEMRNMLDEHVVDVTEDEPEFEWNNGFWIEGLDRILTSSNIIFCMLSDHPAVERAGMKEDIDKLIECMDALYEKMSNTIPDDEW